MLFILHYHYADLQLYTTHREIMVMVRAAGCVVAFTETSARNYLPPRN